MKILIKIPAISGILLSMLLFILRCENVTVGPDKMQSDSPSDGFSIIFGDSLIFNHQDIDYYDASTNMIYLKKENSPLRDFMGYGSFAVYADKDKIYGGQVFPGYSSSMPIGPLIWSAPSFYPDYTIRIDFSYYIDSLGNPSPEDPRSDSRIINALKKFNQYHVGLTCSIDRVARTKNGLTSFTYTVNNNDSYNYYILSPDKMGLDLFHYFTNGLFIIIPGSDAWYYQRKDIDPEPWDSWNIAWFDFLPAGSSRSYMITYPPSGAVPPGEYEVIFEFPGMSHQISREELMQITGRIWLGDIRVIKTIEIN